MNYNQDIEAIAAVLVQDKALHPKWKNKAVARLEEAQAFIAMGLDESRIYNPTPTVASNPQTCICRPGTLNSKCPVHGRNTA